MTIHNFRFDLSGSLQTSKWFIERALDYSKDISIGNGPQGPFDHLCQLKTRDRSSHSQRGFNPADLFLYAVTDSGMNKRWDRSITDAVKAAVEGGATIVQIRFVKCLLLINLLFCLYKRFSQVDIFFNSLPQKPNMRLVAFLHPSKHLLSCLKVKWH